MEEGEEGSRRCQGGKGRLCPTPGIAHVPRTTLPGLGSLQFAGKEIPPEKGASGGLVLPCAALQSICSAAPGQLGELGGQKTIALTCRVSPCDALLTCQGSALLPNLWRVSA